jgi:hypothetical protein
MPQRSDDIVDHLPAPSRPLAAIGLAGLIVGTLDLLWAMAVYSPHHPLKIPQAVASGVLGKSSFEGGGGTIVLGIALHFLIAYGAATVYFVASRFLKVMVQHPVWCGILFGYLVYGFMHLIVLPLSAVSPSHSPFLYQAAEFLEHGFAVGLPIALLIRRFAPS